SVIVNIQRQVQFRKERPLSGPPLRLYSSLGSKRRTPKNMYPGKQISARIASSGQKNPQPAALSRFHHEVQVPKLLFPNSHYVDNLCQCEQPLLILPEISGFAYPKLEGNRRDMSQRLGDLLVKEKVITPEQLEQATKLQKEEHL